MSIWPWKSLTPKLHTFSTQSNSESFPNSPVDQLTLEVSTSCSFIGSKLSDCSQLASWIARSTHISIKVLTRCCIWPTHGAGFDPCQIFMAPAVALFLKPDPYNCCANLPLNCSTVWQGIIYDVSVQRCQVSHIYRAFFCRQDWLQDP